MMDEMVGGAFVCESGAETRCAGLPAALGVNLVTELPVTV